MMKRAARLFLLVLVFASAIAHAELPQDVVTALQQAQIPQDNVAVFVQRVDANIPLLIHQVSKPFNPASVMKLLTTYAGLSILGPAYRWRTEVYTDGELVNGVLKGNLILKGYGDPALMAEDYWRLLNSLRQLGIKDIQGNLVIDNTWFAPINDNAGAFDGELYRSYNAIPSAMLVNLKSTSFKFQISYQHDISAVSITSEPDLPEIKVTNRMQIIPGDCGDWRNKVGYKIKPVAVNDKLNEFSLEFNGTYPESCGEKYIELSLVDDAAYAFYLFHKLWLQLGGTIQGTLQRTISPIPATKFTEQTSEPMADIVRRINKYSNNLMARQLLLTIGAEKIATPANEVGGTKAITDWLASKRMSFPELVIDNGAGLSRNARISAQHLGTLLLDAYASPVMPEFMSSLPILSLDGTMARRMKDSPLSGRAHLKTGSLNGVSTIAGYVLDNKGRRWAMVFMINHPLAANSKVAQDALINWVYQQP
ncbi:D-alanyl-D-alanine carboxypeptidase/D-alanyl-D-alanine-endopeptidase [Methylovorus sp. MM2]|uniref:D-alanyl-D-alanine carboxypeptidase/D-alanyl-D-alanine endopeptidase n=1 Tax=Methylovorus sp. MM2 TaxID=1848038 RepID=UPI000A9326C5